MFIYLAAINLTLTILVRKDIIVKSHCNYYFYPYMAFPQSFFFIPDA